MSSCQLLELYWNWVPAETLMRRRATSVLLCYFTACCKSIFAAVGLWTGITEQLRSGHMLIKHRVTPFSKDLRNNFLER